jgi:hypothetical protein
MPTVSAMLPGCSIRIIRPMIESPMQVTLESKAIIQPVKYPGFNESNIHCLVWIGAFLKYPNGVEPQFMILALGLSVSIIPCCKMI